MIITFTKEDFLEKLYPSMATVSNKSTVVSIEGVLIETQEGGRLRLTTYDMLKGVRSFVENVTIEEEGSYIINATRLLQILKAFPDGSDITIEVDEKLAVKIYSGKASFSLFAMRGNEFPSLPDLEGISGFTVASGILKRIIGKVIHSVATQDNGRPALCGAYFRFEKDALDVTSCDSYILSKCRVKCTVEDIMERSAFKDDVIAMIIPGHALGEIARLLDDTEEPVKIYLGYKHAIFHVGGVIFFTRLIDGAYIDYSKILPKNPMVFITLDRDRFLASLERAFLVAEEKFASAGRSFVKLTVEDDTLTITSSSSSGKVYDEMECIHEGEKIAIGFNCRFLLNTVRVADSDKIMIAMTSPSHSITIEPAESERCEERDFFYVVQPLRMIE